MPQKLRQVDPKKIKIPEVRVTARMDEETTRQFENSIKETGIDEPIKCYQVDGELILSDGKHRLMAALQVGLDTVPVYVREGTMEDVLCNNLMSGHLRGKHPVSEMVESITALSTEYAYDSEKIAAKTGLTRDYVESLQLLFNLTPLCRAALDEGTIKVGQAKALVRLADPVQQETVLQMAILYRWRVKETADFVSGLMETKPAPTAEHPATEAPQYAPVKCFYCQEEHMPQELANPNTCMACSHTMLQSMALARMELEKDLNAKNDSAKPE